SSPPSSVPVGWGAMLREIFAAVGKLLGGMSARESTRKVDIVQQRDAALAREARAWTLVDAEAAKRRRVQEWAAMLQRQLILAGIDPTPEPVLEQTITKAQLAELRRTEESP
ncbi:MAG: hypothetical protein U1E32_02835, partial [Rhodoglobus sp.]|nr:hypothetical protein [Rhodoglobus sp.]